jgi:hypothetical protein
MRTTLTILLRSLFALRSLCVGGRVGACLLWTVPAYAVQPYTPVSPDPILEPWRWRTYAELKNTINMAEASDGSPWIAAGDDGVRHYNGVEVVSYTSEDIGLAGAVWAICAGRDGAVYAGGDRGISRFKKGQWHRISPKGSSLFWQVMDVPHFGAVSSRLASLRASIARLQSDARGHSVVLDTLGYPSIIGCYSNYS